MKLRPDDTIAAIATPLGEGAISVVRMTGGRALGIADSVFRGGKRVTEMDGHTVGHGKIVDQYGCTIDDVLVTVFREPRSYTGENLVEISCHGGIQVTKSVLEHLLLAGARLADPGEFTRRAFLNGKLDLSQAEAVADLISAKSEKAQRASIAQLEGGLAEKIDEFKSRLMSLCALLEVDLDLSEEGISVAPRDSILSDIDSLSARLESLIASYRSGRLLRNGVMVAIIGRPNAGKSSLFNALLRTNRSIVSPVPGTTRDFLEEEAIIEGILFKLRDTAGIRTSMDPVEVEGVARTRRTMEEADVILLVVDSSSGDSIQELIEESQSRLRDEQRLVVALNKCDLKRIEAGSIGTPAPGGLVHTSATDGYGLDELCRCMVQLVEPDHKSDIEVTSARHREVLRNALVALSNARNSMAEGATFEFVALDIRGCIDSLSEITGEITSDDILNRIFSNFCVGK